MSLLLTSALRSQLKLHGCLTHHLSFTLKTELSLFLKKNLNGCKFQADLVLYLIEFSCLELCLCQGECAVLHDVPHLSLGLDNLLEDLPESHLKSIRLLLQQAVALLGTLQP